MGNNKTIRITNIQRMCFHDGPGIRTTVFLKGCSINCPWCSNPENLSFNIEPYEIHGVKGQYGEDVSAEQLFMEVMKDKAFWGETGGITLSGGEALLQSEALLPFLQRVKSEKVNVALETALFVPRPSLVPIINYVDYIISDVKILNSEHCKGILGGDLSVFLDNVEYINKKNKIKLFRVPLCHEYTLNDDNTIAMIRFFQRYNNIPVQIFKVHSLGESKYDSLHKKCGKFKDVSDGEIEALKDEFARNNISAEIIRI